MTRSDSRMRLVHRMRLGSCSGSHDFGGQQQVVATDCIVTIPFVCYRDWASRGLFVLLKKLALGLAGVCAVAITGVAHAAEPVMYQEITENKPDLGANAKAYVGDRMLYSRSGQFKQCITPRFDALKTMLGANFVVKSGEPLCKGVPSDEKYNPENYINGSQGITQKVNYKAKSDGSFQLCANSMCTDTMPADALTVGPTFISNKASVNQSIEYAGKSGGFLKFIYAETGPQGERIREFQIPENSAEMQYRGAIIQIAKAGDGEIEYKVVRSFQ